MLLARVFYFKSDYKFMRTLYLFSKTKRLQNQLTAIITIATIWQALVPHGVAFASEIGTGVPANEFAVQSGPFLPLADLQKQDPLVRLVSDYLKQQKSPLEVYTAEIVQLPRFEMALAVSKVESGMGVRCAGKDNNCSGIGVHPTHPSWRRYPTKLHWFKDMSALMEKPFYKERYNTCQKMRGVYVVPGSDNWVRGCQKVYNDLVKIREQAEIERRELAASHAQKAVLYEAQPAILAIK